jgi:5-methylcytosine-specific restriction endonuclease McrA
MAKRKQSKLSSSQEYAAKFKDPRWQKKRLQILERDKWACSVCGDASSTLHVHHGYYESKYEPWDYSDDTLHTLCEECHSWANDLRRDLHFEMAKLPIEFQARLLSFVAAMRNKGHGTILPLLHEAEKKLRSL